MRRGGDDGKERIGRSCGRVKIIRYMDAYHKFKKEEEK